jgi:hypothetical protein
LKTDIQALFTGFSPFARSKRSIMPGVSG